jgi:hypothetical protein
MHLILWEDYMYTGNDEYLKRYYPDLKRIVEEVVFDENGLIENTGNNDIIDWPAVERDGYQIGKVNNVPNAFYCKSLELLSQIAGVINKQDDSIYFAEKFLKYKTIFNTVFWDEKNGLYIDAIGNIHSSLHANIFPVAFGLASPVQIQKIIPFIKSKEMAVSVYGAQYLLDALYLISEDEYALKLMTSDNERSWINMINRGGTITWEAWSEKVKGNLDWNHAWGAAPGNIISRRLFGIRPAKPGFKEAIIQPQFAGLKNGKIIQPTINGPVEMKFDNNNSTKLAIEVKLNMPAKIILPVKKYDPPSVELNNVKVKPLVEGEYLVIPISEENNKIIIEKQQN